MSRNKDRVNYKEPKDFTTRRPKGPNIKIIEKIPNHEKYTIYNEFKRHGMILDFSDDIEMENNSSSSTEWYPLCVTSLASVDGEPAINTKIETKTEIGYTLILEKEWIPETYLGALAAIKPNKLTHKKWKHIYYQRKLPDTYCPKYSINDKVYLTIIVHCYHKKKCQCNVRKIIVYGTIKGVDAHKLALQLTPQFLFEAENEELSSIANGWVFTAQLSRKPEKWRYITISDIVLCEIRYYISLGYTKFTTSDLIIGDIPDDIKINSAYFGQYECYVDQQVPYRLALQSKPLIIFLAKKTLKQLIQNTYSSISSGRSSILSFSINRRMTKQNVLLYGVPLEPMILQIGMIALLNSLNETTQCDPKKISFCLSVDNLAVIEIDKVLDILSNKTEIHLNGGIKFVWHRATQHIFASKFSIIKTKCKK